MNDNVCCICGKSSAFPIVRLCGAVRCAQLALWLDKMGKYEKMLFEIYAERGALLP